jgi:endonuclease/exonuclease/phosphatase (EEP) superfamily protein YafD
MIAGRPVPMWVFRMDYILHSDDWVALSAKLGKWDGISDHRPIVSTLELLQ